MIHGLSNANTEHINQFDEILHCMITQCDEFCNEKSYLIKRYSKIRNEIKKYRHYWVLNFAVLQFELE